MRVNLTVNGQARSVDVAADTPLLWVLRDDLGMTGTKFGCGRAFCGACTVHVDGKAVRSCAMPIEFAEGKDVRTIEALEADPVGKAVIDAWIEKDVVQCGWCQPGQCMSATALLKEVPNPTQDDIDRGMAGNICRCGTYPRVKDAILTASAALREGGDA